MPIYADGEHQLMPDEALLLTRSGQTKGNQWWKKKKILFHSFISSVNGTRKNVACMKNEGGKVLTIIDGKCRHGNIIVNERLLFFIYEYVTSL